MTLHRRDMRLHLRADEAAADPAAPIRLIASTDTMLERGPYFREQLLHTPEAVTIAARTLLLNHDENQIIGRAVDIALVERQSIATVEFAPTAAGVEAEQLVRGGYLEGVSIGYSIESYEIREDQDGVVTVIATAWTLREISLTPIPADLACGVAARSVEDPQAWAQRLGLVRSLSQQSTIQPTESAMDEITKNAQPQAPVAAPSTRAQTHLDLISLARKHAVDLSPEDLSSIDTREAGVELILARKQSTTSPTAPAAPIGGTRAAPVAAADEMDKAAAELNELWKSGASLSDAARKVGGRLGLIERGLGNKAILDEVAEGFQAMGKRATTTSAGFGLVTQLAAAKAIIDGYNGYESVYETWCKEIFVPDFNTVTVSDLGFSEFVAPGAEGGAYADNVPSIVGGSGSNEFLGTNFDLSLAAVYNDRAGVIQTKLANLGLTGRQTLDQISQNTLAAASFSAATSVLAFNATNLEAGWSSHAAVTLKGRPAKRLIVPMGLYVAACNATTPANGATAGRVLANGRDAIQVVPGWYLADTNDWYLAADGAVAPSIVILRHPDYREPRLVYKGEGGGAAMLFRIDFPAKAIALFTAANKPLCAYKFTQP